LNFHFRAVDSIAAHSLFADGRTVEIRCFERRESREVAPANSVAGLEASGLIASHRWVNSGMRPFKRGPGREAMASPPMA
jgi:hypothetical protein